MSPKAQVELIAAASRALGFLQAMHAADVLNATSVAAQLEQALRLARQCPICEEIARGTNGQTRECADHSTSGWGAR